MWKSFCIHLSNSFYELISEAYPMNWIVKLVLGECHKTPLSLMINGLWISKWQSAISQQAITWFNVDLKLCCHMASLGYNESIYHAFPVIDDNYFTQYMISLFPISIFYHMILLYHAKFYLAVTYISRYFISYPLNFTNRYLFFKRYF